ASSAASTSQLAPTPLGDPATPRHPQKPLPEPSRGYPCWCRWAAVRVGLSLTRIVMMQRPHEPGNLPGTVRVWKCCSEPQTYPSGIGVYLLDLIAFSREVSIAQPLPTWSPD